MAKTNDDAFLSGAHLDKVLVSAECCVTGSAIDRRVPPNHQLQGLNTVQISITDWRPIPQLSLPLDAHEFVIGDVHGCLDQFAALTDAMASASEGRGHLTLLGDLIDRGPSSVGCLRHAATLLRGSPGFADCHLLVGNHELMAIQAMTAPVPADPLALWCSNGGDIVLREFGLDKEVAAKPGVLKEVIREHAGDDVLLMMLHGWKTHRLVGNVLLVHAGIHPEANIGEWFGGDPLTKDPQDEDHHFAWIRFPFLRHAEAYPGGCIVVHGHMPERVVQSWKGRSPEMDHVPSLDGWRLGLDGGSYSTGAVLGAEIRKGEYRVYRSSSR